MVVEHAHGLRQRRGPNAKSSLHKAHLAPDAGLQAPGASLSRSEEHTSELQSLMRISYAVFCLKKKIHLTFLHIILYSVCTNRNRFTCQLTPATQSHTQPLT